MSSYGHDSQTSPEIEGNWHDGDTGGPMNMPQNPDSTLRICFVSMHTSPIDTPGSGDAGGMNVVELQQAKALADWGHTVEIVTRRSDPLQPEVVQVAPKVTVRHVTAGPPRPLPKSQIHHYIEEFAAGLSQLPRPDVYHSHHWMSGMAALPIARRTRVPHVQSYHSVAATPGSPLSSGEPPEAPERVAGEARLAHDSDLVVAISAAEACTVVDRCGAQPDRVVIVPPGVDHSVFHPYADPLIPDDVSAELIADLQSETRGFVLFAARLQPLKGPDLAIEALAHVPPKIRPHLVIAGDVSADFEQYHNELTTLVQEWGLDNQVHFIGPQTRPALARLMSEARLVLVPSHSETFGLIALESQACGTPVIAAAAGGLREAVVHRETGHLMDSRDPYDWALAMKQLLSTPGLLDRMGTVSQIHAQRFQWSWVARRLVDHYRNLIVNGKITS